MSSTDRDHSTDGTMTTGDTDETVTSPSRRAMLGAGLAGTVLGVALARPGVVSAADNDPVLVGQPHTASNSTTITNASGDAITGITGNSNSSGVSGSTNNLSGGTGVSGTSAGSGAGVAGISAAGHGVEGRSVSSIGVIGQSESGVGVYGLSTDGTGVVALTTSTEPALLALSSSVGAGGVAVRAQAPTGGTAISAVGRVDLDRSGRATIRAGKRSVRVTVPGGLTGASLAFANLTAYRRGVHIAAVTSDPTTERITIRLNKAVAAATPVAWFVLR